MLANLMFQGANKLRPLYVGIGSINETRRGLHDQNDKQLGIDDYFLLALAFTSKPYVIKGLILFVFVDGDIVIVIDIEQTGIHFGVVFVCLIEGEFRQVVDKYVSCCLAAISCMV